MEIEPVHNQFGRSAKLSSQVLLQYYVQCNFQKDDTEMLFWLDFLAGLQSTGFFDRDVFFKLLIFCPKNEVLYNEGKLLHFLARYCSTFLWYCFRILLRLKLSSFNQYLVSEYHLEKQSTQTKESLGNEIQQ